jgi:predicted nucleic acid-binding protein
MRMNGDARLVRSSPVIPNGPRLSTGRPSFSVVRGLALAGKVSQEVGERAVARIPRLGIDHVSLDELLPRMWQIRGSISGYDAAYVALAESRSLTLITGDAKLAKAATSFCRIELT